ncbi:MAG: carboxy terminal-processing peptidase [Planctomycetales bacterium]|nr:carboxy terminal-processing peptidase [Planctomycetales bacterium]
MKFTPFLRARAALTVGLMVLVGTTIFAQQLSSASPAEQETAKLVSNMIKKYHISQKPLDDRISAMLLQRFVKELDPQKFYFLQGDIDDLAKYRDHLDDLLKMGDVKFAHELFLLYVKRLDERIVTAHKFIDTPQDFTNDENLDIDGEKLSWSIDLKEVNERWRKKVKYELLTLQLDKIASEKARERLHKRYDTLRRTAHEMEDSEVLEMYLSSMAHCFDPHSSYMSKQTVEDFEIQMRLSLEGIGAALQSEDGVTVVKQIVAGGAAEKDGRLTVGDKITAVAQEEGDFQDIVEMKLNRVVRLIRGQGGTNVRLRVVKETGETAVYALTRQTIELKSQEVKGEIIQSNERISGTKQRVGIINIPSFYRDFGGAQQGKDDFKSTARDVRKVLEDFRDQGGVDCVIVDLRMNGGGALSEAIEVSGLFIDRGPVVQIKESNGRTKSHDDDEGGSDYSGPLVVLCNRLSASASEIFAAAIKDYGRGIVVGDTTTHGKGTVQNVMPVSSQMFGVLGGGSKDRGAVKLTINQFYRVNGDSTQNRGVESDIVIPSLIDHMDLGESFMENALAFDHIPSAKHASYNMASPEIVSELKDASRKRVASDPKFQQIQRDIDRFLARKNRKSVSLNEQQLTREREEDKAAKEVEKEEEEHETKSEELPVFAKSEYNDEVLHIAVDYSAQLKAVNTAGR